MFNGQHPRNYPSERDTRLLRVHAGDYASIVTLASSLGVTAADALHEWLKYCQLPERKNPEFEPEKQKAQMSMNGIVHINLADTQKVRLSDTIRARVKEV